MEKLDNIVMYSPEDVRKLLHLGNACLIPKIFLA